MFWQLTLLALLFFLPTGEAAASRRTAAGASFSVRWEQLPLADAVEHLRSMSRAEVFVDRRVDPNQRVTLAVADASAEEIADQLATTRNLGTERLGRLLYIGPQQTASRLAALVAARRKEVTSLSPDIRPSLVERRKIVWPRLTEPRDLISRLARDHGWKIEHADRIPHDLWAAGELPNLPLADQLTLLLVGFDLTYRIHPERRVIEAIPIDWTAIAPAASSPTVTRRTTRPPARATKQVFTLRIENQPAGRVLKQLAQRLGWQIEVDDAALKRAGRSLDTQVSFVVENADEDELLAALLTPAGLTAERDGSTIRIAPR